MPSRLRVQLENENKSGTSEPAGIIEVLGRLCDQDTSVQAAYLCHPAVQCINKTKKEGNLCGYRNIQMMISFINGAKAQGSEHFPNGLPSVLGLQDLIEEAWDKGINGEGRVETGGIRGTRKYIGTPEVRHEDAKAILQLPDKIPKLYYLF
jgi:zinc finger-containing ubiquitin peptidase 1